MYMGKQYQARRCYRRQGNVHTFLTCIVRYCCYLPDFRFSFSSSNRLFPQGVIQKIAEIHKLRCVASLGLRLTHLRSDALHWLHPDLGVSHVREKYEKQHPQEEWR